MFSWISGNSRPFGTGARSTTPAAKWPVLFARSLLSGQGTWKSPEHRAQFESIVFRPATENDIRVYCIVFDAAVYKAFYMAAYSLARNTHRCSTKTRLRCSRSQRYVTC